MRRLSFRQVLACLLVGGALSLFIATRASFSETGAPEEPAPPKEDATPADSKKDTPPPKEVPLPAPKIDGVFSDEAASQNVYWSGNAWFTNLTTFTLKGTAEDVADSSIVFFQGPAQSPIANVKVTRDGTSWRAT